MTLALLDNVWHGDTASADDSVVLSVDEGVLTLVQTVTDADAIGPARLWTWRQRRVPAILSAADVQAQFATSLRGGWERQYRLRLALTGSNVASGLYAVDRWP
ncbi:hypothetical protein ACOYXV_05570 [Aeromonas veronii]